MWVNAMLTIWLFGTLASLALICVILWLWYLPRSSRKEEDTGHDG